MLHLVGCLYYLYRWCTVKQISDNKIYLLIKYIKSVLWWVAKCLSYIEEAWCLKIKHFSLYCGMVESTHGTIAETTDGTIAETTADTLDEWCYLPNIWNWTIPFNFITFSIIWCIQINVVNTTPCIQINVVNTTPSSWDRINPCLQVCVIEHCL